MILAALLLLSVANDAVVPVPINDPGWMRRHETLVAAAKKGNVDLIFVGASITQFFPERGKDTWDYYYGDRKPLDLGISGDRTQHVLWRLDNGEVDGIKPKVAVVNIGSNNTVSDTAEQVAEGVEAVCAKIAAKQPRAKILLLAIFPRDKAGSDLRAKVVGADALLAKWAPSHKVTFLDIGHVFLDRNNELPADLMPDLLHPTAKGYRLWAEAMEPTLAKLLGVKAIPPMSSKTSDE